MQENFVRNTALQLAVSLLVLLAGAAIGIYVERTQSSEENRTRYLEFETSHNAGILSRPLMPGRNLEILLDSEPIDNISSTSVRIYNFSDRDLEDVPVFIELRPGSDDSVLEVLHQKILGPGGIEETVHLTSSTKTNVPYRLGFSLATVNRSLDTTEPVFQAHFIAKGEKPPVVDLLIDKKGVKLRPYFTRWPEKGFLDFLVFMWSDSRLSLFVLLGLFLLLLPVVRFTKKAEAIFNRRKQKGLRDALIRELDSPVRREALNLSADVDEQELSKFFVEFSSEFSNEHPETLRNLLRAWKDDTGSHEGSD